MIHPTKWAEFRQAVEAARAADPDDNELLADMLEGADFHEIVARCFQRRRECLANKGAMEDLVAYYKARAGQEEARAERIGQLLGRLRELSGQNIKHPMGSVISYATDQWEVTEDASVDDVPEEFVRITKSLDKVAMKKAAENGRNVPGVQKTRKRVTQIRG